MTSWNGIGEIDCASCGARCSVEGDYTEGAPGVAGESPRDPDEFKPAETRCPACLSLGDGPPPSPCCRMRLYGHDDGPDGWSLACGGCDALFDVSCIRSYALGLAVERIILTRTAKRDLRSLIETFNLILAAAARLYVRRKDGP